MSTTNPPQVTTSNSSISSFDHLASANSSPKALNHDNPSHHHDSVSTSLTARLNNYKYLDDYEYYRAERLKQSALRKFGLIMQSVKTSYKDCSQSALDENDSDVIEESASDFSNFNQILKRHRKHFRQNLAIRHHR